MKLTMVKKKPTGLCLCLLVVLAVSSFPQSDAAPTSVRPTAGDSCDPTNPSDSWWWTVDGTDSLFLFCHKTAGKWIQDACASLNGNLKVFHEEYQQCVPRSSSKKMKQPDYNPLSFKFNAAARSGRVSSSCSMNTDCLDGMYCEQGQCSCLSNYVQREDYCYSKINPTSSGCNYDEQCNAVWPGATCSSNNICTCPTGYPRAAQTRDGWVCLRSTANICPLPQQSVTDTLSRLIPYNGAYATNFAQCNPATTSVTTLTTAGACSSYTDATTAGGYYVGDTYDCIGTTDSTTASGSSASSGVCCPSRALTCNMPIIEDTTDAGGIPTPGLVTTRWGYNSITGSCSQFYWSGKASPTLGNANNFLTKTHCETYCKDTCRRGRPQYSSTASATSTSSSNTVGYYQRVPISCSSVSCDTNHECATIGSLKYCCPTATFVCQRRGGLFVNPSFTALPSGVGTEQYIVGVQATQTGAPRQYLPLQRYYYDTTTRTCLSFSWYQQAGSYNNFASKDDCESFCDKLLCDQGEPIKDTNGNNQACSSNSQCPSAFQCSNSVCCPRTQTVCEMTKQTGTCDNYAQRYWYNAVTRECEVFTYTGCQGNANNFETFLDCQNYCRNARPKPNCIQGQAYKDANGNYYQCSNTGTLGNVCPSNYECYYDGYMWGCCPTQAYTCALTSNTGIECGPSVVKWYYDTTTYACQTIEYLGCDGNSNNFATRDLCQDYCGVGGCPNGGTPYRESTGSTRSCNTQVTCPSTHECVTVSQSNSIVNYCCPTRAYICSLPPYSGSDCGTTSITRYYFNLATRACMTFDYYGCGGNGNNYATLSACNNYCNSAACGDGEAAFLNPNTQQILECNINLANSCPNGYKCKFDTLTTRYVCCGATGMGVCPAGEKAFVNIRTNGARICQPNIAGTCPSPFQCRFNARANTYYCCASASGDICPTGKAPHRVAATGLTTMCTLNSVVNPCTTGYSCQSAVQGTVVQGYCCTVNVVCPGGGTYFQDSASNAPRICTFGLAGACPSGYDCIPNTASGGGASFQEGFCCKGSNFTGLCSSGIPFQSNGNYVECNIADTQSCPNNYLCERGSSGKYFCCQQQQLGCPSQEFAQLENNNPVSCATTNPSAKCNPGYTCQFIGLFNRNQCCGRPGTVVTDCPSGMVGFKSAPTLPIQTCRLGVQNTCPGQYSCQYSDRRLQYLCCAETAGCPNDEIAYVNPQTGSVISCAQNAGVCPSGFACQNTTSNSRVCCSGAPITAAPISFVPASCTVGSPQLMNNQFVSCLNTACSAGFTCQQTQLGNICCGIPIAITALPTFFPTAFTQFFTQVFTPAPTQAPVFGQTCPSGSNVQLSSANTPQICTNNQLGCGGGYSCTYSNTLRQYYCCSDVNAVNRFTATPTASNGVNGCPRGSPRLYGSTQQALSCRLGDNCGTGFTCVSSTNPSTFGPFICCSGGIRRSDEEPQDDQANRQKLRKPAGVHRGPACLRSQTNRPCDLDREVRVDECCWTKLNLGQPCLLGEQCSWKDEVSCEEGICRCPGIRVAFNNTCSYGCPPGHAVNPVTRVCQPSDSAAIFPWKDDPIDLDDDSVDGESRR